ncbi:collagen alpha-1(VII) chain-like [Sardina pilchardus]|uniref:collagen alpha-1(VII) chain-like n=1 Tax=Sardina pilchardus TaxID=27697 RepID=UPI002E0F6D7F
MSRVCLPGGVQFREVTSDLSAFTIDRLQPDEYVLIGVAVVIDGSAGESVTLSSRTHGYGITGLRILDVNARSIGIAWDALPTATGYKISWRHSNGAESSRTVASTVTSYTIEGLEENASYRIAVSALIGSNEGTPATVLTRTVLSGVVGTVTDLKVLAPQDEAVKVTWVGVQGATSYRIVWKKTDDGEEQSRLVGPGVTSVDLAQLERGAQYEVQVMALVQNQEGSPVSVRVTTPGVVDRVEGLRVLEARQGTLRLTWRAVAGATGYKLYWSTAGEGERSQLIRRDVTSYDLEGLRPGQNYIIRFAALFQDRESEAVTIRASTNSGEGQSQVLNGSANSFRVSGLRLGRRYVFSLQPTYQNRVGQVATVEERTVCVDGRLDVVFLVPASRDRSRLKDPIISLLTSAAGTLTTIGPRDSQMGVLVYSDVPRVHFLLNRHSNTQTLLQEILSTPFTANPGNAIGQALTYAERYFMTVAAGRRRVPGVVVLIADGRSTDDVIRAATELRATGVTVLAVGIGQAVSEELRRVVTDGSTQNLLVVSDMAQLYRYHPELADLLCGLARGTGVTVPTGPEACTVQCPAGEKGEQGQKVKEPGCF